MGFDRRAYRSLATKEIRNIITYFDRCHYVEYNHAIKMMSVWEGKRIFIFLGLNIMSFALQYRIFYCAHATRYCALTRMKFNEQKNIFQGT